VRTKSKAFVLVILALVGLLIAARIAMPYGLKRYAEHRLNQIPEYQAHIGDVSVQLYKGSYVLKDIDLKKLNQQIPVPFFAAKAVQFRVQWRALLHGSLVAEVQVAQPKLNFVTDPQGKNEQLTIDQQWQQAVKALFPLNFNEIVINNGQIHFRNYGGDSPFNIFLKNIDAKVSNLRQIEKVSEQLSSHIKLHAHAMDGSPIKLNVDLDPSAKQPTFKLTASIEHMTIPTANDFLRHYTKLDIKKGYFNLYVEAAAAHGKITGYAKPMVKDLQVIDPKEKLNPVKALYKGAVQAVANVLENSEQDTVATKIKISGDIKQPNVSIWSIIGNLLRHAFIQALLPQIDHSVKMQDIEVK
jgi:hypothetical protein